MGNHEDKRRKKIYEIISVIKLLSLFFCCIILFSENIFNVSTSIRAFNQIDALILCILSGVLLLTYNVWNFSSKKNASYLNNKLYNIIEISFFMSVFTAIIYLTGSHTSQYKFLYLFIIITASIQFGRTCGLTVATVCSAILLTIDYISLPNVAVNKFFEADLILVGIYILTAWLLGDYVKAESTFRKNILDLANRDELTGLCNHRYFHETLTVEIERAKKTNKPLSLLFMDIDYFKYYNDLYGHLAGDEILKEIGKILKNVTKPEDIAARYGGEEFAVIMPDTTENQALSIGEKIRKIIEDTYFNGEENLPNGNLTVSVGVSCFPDKAKTKTELLNSTDDALYRAKFFSKNRVESYYSILEELKEDIEEEHIDLVSSIKTLISVINAKDRYTYGHTERVVTYCELVADKLELSEIDKKTLKFGAYLHDIGKINVSREILNKKMPLTDDEWNNIKRHPVDGVEIIRTVPSLQKVIPLILYHHERYDGKGYPGNLKENEIPYLARILTVADSFDAMTSDRPYRPRMNFNEAIEELKRCSGSQFDPDIVNVFINVVKENENYLNTFKFKHRINYTDVSPSNS